MSGGGLRSVAWASAITLIELSVMALTEEWVVMPYARGVCKRLAVAARSGRKFHGGERLELCEHLAQCEEGFRVH